MTDNELIAEFMGIKVSIGIGEMLWTCDDDGFIDYVGGDNVYSPANSWSQLMPVVEKIEALPEHPLYKKYRFSVSIKNDSCEISFARLSKGEPGHNHYEGKTKIDAVYKSVIDFIKWYNQQGGSK